VSLWNASDDKLSAEQQVPRFVLTAQARLEAALGMTKG
jgi:hypothetical protein